MKSAVDAFRQRGLDLTPLDTIESAADLEDLRLALSAQQIRLLGISYGTYLALAVIKNYPESIESAVLADVEGLGDTFKLPSRVNEGLSALSAHVANDQALSVRIPGPTALMEQVLKHADDEPFDVNLTDPRTGQACTARVGRFELEAIIWRTLDDRSSMRILPAGLMDLAAGRTQSLARVVPGMRQPRTRQAMSWAMDAASGATASRFQQISEEA